MLDLLTFGETMAVLAPLGEGRFGDIKDFSLRIAGAESNTAIGVAKLGHSAAWLSALGTDSLGDYVLGEIAREGVDVSLVKRDETRRTGLMMKEFGEGKTTVWYYRENSAASGYTPDLLPREAVKNAKLVHLTGISPLLSETCFESVKELMRLAREAGATVTFDPNVRYKLWGGVDRAPMLRELMFASDAVLLGLEEGRALLGADTPREVADALISKGVRYAAVKDGDKGAFCATAEEEVFIPPLECNCIDPVGAGDGFNAGFICGLLEGASLRRCALMGAVVGAMATETIGDADGYPRRAELDARIKKAEGEIK